MIMGNIGGSLTDHVYSFFCVRSLDSSDFCNLFRSICVIRGVIIGSCVVEICPMASSAAMEPRASHVWPPCDCATGCALVLEYVWMKLHRQLFLCKFWNHLSLVLFF